MCEQPVHNSAGCFVWFIYIEVKVGESKLWQNGFINLVKAQQTCVIC